MYIFIIYIYIYIYTCIYIYIIIQALRVLFLRDLAVVEALGRGEEEVYIQQ
jgi:hypothetical protein